MCAMSEVTASCRIGETMKDAISYKGRVNHRNSEGAVDDPCFQIPFHGQGFVYVLMTHLCKK